MYIICSFKNVWIHWFTRIFRYKTMFPTFLKKLFWSKKEGFWRINIYILVKMLFHGYAFHKDLEILSTDKQRSSWSCLKKEATPVCKKLWLPTLAEYSFSLKTGTQFTPYHKYPSFHIFGSKNWESSFVLGDKLLKKQGKVGSLGQKTLIERMHHRHRITKKASNFTELSAKYKLYLISSRRNSWKFPTLIHYRQLNLSPLRYTDVV